MHPDGAATSLSRNPYFDLLHFTDLGIAEVNAALTRDALLITLGQDMAVSGAILPSGSVAWVTPDTDLTFIESGAALLALPT